MLSRRTLLASTAATLALGLPAAAATPHRFSHGEFEIIVQPAIKFGKETVSKEDEYPTSI